MSNKTIDQVCEDFKKDILEIFLSENTALAKLKETVIELQQRLAEYEPAEFITPEYGTIPVAPVIHEQVIELARNRGISPGLLMQKEDVTRHLLLLFEHEII